MAQRNINRRSFVQTLLAFAGLSTFGIAAFAQQKRQPKKDGAAGGGGEPICKQGEGAAAVINYHANHEAVKDAKLKIEKQGVPFEKQYCSNCMFYAKVGEQGGGEVGHCQLIKGCLVSAKGWSTSWAKKA